MHIFSLEIHALTHLSHYPTPTFHELWNIAEHYLPNFLGHPILLLEIGLLYWDVSYRTRNTFPIRNTKWSLGAGIVDWEVRVTCIDECETGLWRVWNPCEWTIWPPDLARHRADPSLPLSAMTKTLVKPLSILILQVCTIILGNILSNQSLGDHNVLKSPKKSELSRQK